MFHMLVAQGFVLSRNEKLIVNISFVGLFMVLLCVEIKGIKTLSQLLATRGFVLSGNEK